MRRAIISGVAVSFWRGNFPKAGAEEGLVLPRQFVRHRQNSMDAHEANKPLPGLKCKTLSGPS